MVSPPASWRPGNSPSGRRHLAEAAFAAYAELADRYDVIVCEGAGSPAEINLRAGDYVNMGLAQRFSLPVIVVGDIDRGGVFASLFGTQALLDDADRALLRGFVINKFRGDVDLLRPGLDRIDRADRGAGAGRAAVARPGCGWTARTPCRSAAGASSTAVADLRSRSMAEIRCGWRSFAFPDCRTPPTSTHWPASPGVQVTMTTDPAVLRSADLVVLPGSRSTVADLEWLRRTGLAAAVVAAATGGRSGAGDLRRVSDAGSARSTTTIESGAGSVPGLGLLPTSVTFGAAKVLAGPPANGQGEPVAGYEIHHGIAEPWPARRGAIPGRISGRFGVGHHVARRVRERRIPPGLADGGDRGRRPAVHGHAGALGFADRREAMIDRLADAVAEHLDTDALLAWSPR